MYMLDERLPGKGGGRAKVTVRPEAHNGPPDAVHYQSPTLTVRSFCTLPLRFFCRRPLLDHDQHLARALLGGRNWSLPALEMP